jgi:hypothetical protein
MIFCVGCEMVGIARSLVFQGSYGNPYSTVNTGLTAANPPIYPLFLAVLIELFKRPTTVGMVANVCNMLANAFTAALLPGVSRVFYASRWPGILGAMLWLASMQLMPSWDVGFTVAGLLLFCVFSASHLGTGRNSLSALWAGAIAGILFLLNSSAGLVVLPWIAYLMIHRRVTWRQTAILLATVCLFTSIWVGRNYLRFGELIVRTGMGIALYTSNNDCAQSSIIADESTKCYASYHPNESAQEAQLMRSMGEVEYDRKRGADAKAWIAAHPGRFWTLTIERFRDFWFPPPYRHPLRIYMVWLTTVLSVPGLLLMIHRRVPVTAFIFAVFLIYPPMFYVNVSDVRYRFPVLWLSLLPAGYFVRESYTYWSERRMSGRSLRGARRVVTRP